MKKISSLILSCVPLLSFGHSVVARSAPSELEPVVVTATRSPLPLRQVGSSITVITADDLSARHVQTVSEALRGVPGLDVMRSGGPGQVTSVFLRGANSNHTLVLIDGMEMNDPGNPAGTFDFADLQTDQIERIEILRGGESSLYGSDAIGGVINIITRKGQGVPQLHAFAEGGLYDTYKTGGSISGSRGPLQYQLGASRYQTGGVSAADRRYGNTERDAYANTTVTQRLGYVVNDQLELDWSTRFQQAGSDLDACNGKACDDPNYRSSTEQLYTRGQGQLSLFDQRWTQTLGLAYTRSDRRLVNPLDTLHPLDKSQATYLGEKLKVDWLNRIRLHETNTLGFGIEDEEDRVTQDYQSISQYGPYNSLFAGKTMNTIGFFGNDQIDLAGYSHTHLAVRYDENNRFGGKVTWRATEIIPVDAFGLSLKGGYGTGFKSPTLSQLYAPLDFGGGFIVPSNPDLKPETSINWDAGVEYGLAAHGFKTGATWFDNHYRQLIDFGPSFLDGLQNLASARSSGVETFFDYTPIKAVHLTGQYTWTQTHNAATGLTLLRRPEHKGSFTARYQWPDTAGVQVTVLMIGQRDDIASIGTRVQAPGYVLVNLAGDYALNRQIKLYGRLDNVFDQSYQEVYGYGTYGIAAYGGIAVNY